MLCENGCLRMLFVKAFAYFSQYELRLQPLEQNGKVPLCLSILIFYELDVFNGLREHLFQITSDPMVIA